VKPANRESPKQLEKVIRGMNSDIKTSVQTFVIDHFVKIPDMVVDDDMSFLESGLIDSMGALELVAFLEETFKFSVEDEEIIPENLDSISRLVKYINLKIGA
jgi:acyl carrier protein